MHIISEISSISSIITIKILKIDSQQFPIVIHIPEVERQHPSSLLFCPYGVAGRIQPIKVSQYVDQSRHIQAQINLIDWSIEVLKSDNIEVFPCCEGWSLVFYFIVLQSSGRNRHFGHFVKLEDIGEDEHEIILLLTVVDSQGSIMNKFEYCYTVHH